MRTLVFASTFLMATLLGNGEASALHCRGRLVRVGQSSAEVLSLCGEPTQISQHEESQSRTIERRTRYGIVYDTITISVAVERWTYDFGPQRFVQRLVFVDGDLARIEVHGYGTPGHDPAPKRAKTLLAPPGAAPIAPRIDAAHAAAPSCRLPRSVRGS